MKMKIRTKIKAARLILFALVLSVFGFSGVSFAGQIDFNSWAAVGAGYTWTVSDDAWTGSDVKVESVPSGPEGLFINGSASTNYILTGKMGVEHSSDDDMIGLVFGYQDASHYYALDWKQKDQYWSSAQAYEGFTLFRIDGSTVDSWNHPTDSNDILFTQYSSTEGWADNTEYGFTLTYTPTSISIVIGDGTNTLFSHTETGSFADGQYGAYNFSQAKTRYSDFQVSSVPIPGALWLLGSGLFGLMAVRKRKKA